MLDYGIVGNCLTCALVSKEAAVEWMCFPSFSSPSLFGRLLDKHKGGSLHIGAKGFRATQRYIENTAILETTFEGDKESFVVYDFFPRYKKLARNNARQLVSKNQFVRIIRPLKGKPSITLHYHPRPNYALETYSFQEQDGLLMCESTSVSLPLISNIPYEAILNEEPTRLDHTKYLVFGNVRDGGGKYSCKYVYDLMRATKRYWEKWVGTLVLPEQNRETIVRSAITLKLLTYSKTGAIVAAPTTSIPEEIGSQRTWDYRYCWVRDSALTVDALKKIGRDYEAKRLMEFILRQVQRDDFIQIMYGIHEETRLTEQELPHLEGFRGSRPVRIGNAAYRQIQNDIYGEILDVLYLYFTYYGYERKMTAKYWRFIIFLVNQIRFMWEKPDSGIWEFRGLPEHYTYSKLMCYVGVDRAIRMAEDFNKGKDLQGWRELREEIRENILTNAYNEDVEAFTINYGSDKLDAAILLMSYHGFLDHSDPRLVNTVRAVYKELRHGYLVQRYNSEDDFGFSGSAFTICSFWLVDALYCIGEEQKSRAIYDKLLKHGNHLGLFSEDIDIKSGKLVGNFPQAYTHIALINSSLLLSEWSTQRKRITPEMRNHRRRCF